MTQQKICTNRALAIEQLIDDVDLERECMHKKCDFVASREALASHAKGCMERPVSCPDFTCNKVIPIRRVICHLKQGESRNEMFGNEEHIEYTMSVDEFKKKNDINWQCMDIMRYNQQVFLPAFTRRDGVYYAWVYVLTDPIEAKGYSATIHLGEGSQSGLIHTGGVVSIDMRKDDILKARSGVLSFAQSGMIFSVAITLFLMNKSVQNGGY